MELVVATRDILWNFQVLFFCNMVELDFHAILKMAKVYDPLWSIKYKQKWHVSLQAEVFRVIIRIPMSLTCHSDQGIPGDKESNNPSEERLEQYQSPPLTYYWRNHW